jgi:energy-converting hydrogenase B subunit D
MNMETLFDLLLAFAMIWSAWRSLTVTRLDRAIVMFIVFGLLVAIAWVRLSAPDVGLADAAIGAGLSGALLLDAYGVFKRRET